MIRRISPMRRGDDGLALLMVVASSLILTLIATAGLGYAVRDQRQSRHDQDYTAALQAATAGVQDYIAFVNQYGQAYNTTSSLYCANPAMQGGDSQLPSSCSWGSTPAWVKVSDPSGSNPIPEYYHYDVDTTNAVANGQVVVTSTGKVNGVTRTVQATVTDGGASDYVYFTDYETQDPAISGHTECRPLSGSIPLHWWEMTQSQRKTADSNYCNIDFVTGDVLAGPVHTNDTARVADQPEFGGDFTTSDPACKQASSSNDYKITSANDYKDIDGCYRDGGSAAAKFDQPPPAWIKSWVPDDNTNTLKATAQSAGCVYTGPTRIKFLSNGTMQVWSRYTTSVNSGCGSVSSLQSSSGATVTIPANFLVFVQNVPGGTSKQCAAGAIGDGLPLSGDANMASADQYCNEGNVYVEGSVNGRLTVAAENDVVVTGDILDSGGLNGDDIIGLVALNYIEVFHPVKKTWSGYSDLSSSWPHETVSGVLEIDAAMEALQHVFEVQAFQYGSPQGTIKLRGTIAQKYRGPVGTHYSDGTIASGYHKDYAYDSRLKYGPPPYFPHWTNATWSVTIFGEINPKY